MKTKERVPCSSETVYDRRKKGTENNISFRSLSSAPARSHSPPRTSVRYVREREESQLPPVTHSERDPRERPKRAVFRQGPLVPLPIARRRPRTKSQREIERERGRGRPTCIWLPHCVRRGRSATCYSVELRCDEGSRRGTHLTGLEVNDFTEGEGEE